MKIILAHELSSLESDRLESLADEFKKLKCRVDITRTLHNEITRLRVVPLKYPFRWCINKLGWDTEPKVSSVTGGVYSRDGAFRLKYIWQGAYFLMPIGEDWNTEDSK